MDLVTEAAEIARIAEALARAPVVAFDLEFASADRLVPRLCLIQVAWLDEQGHRMLDAAAARIVAVEPELRLVDPLAVDPAPIVAALAAHPHVIAHAPRQDLQLLATRFGLAAMPGLIDTQLLAAFAGHGDQVGLASLANELLGTNLGKDQQWTAWERRPLTEAQLAYAGSDVRYLPAIYSVLANELGPEKLEWARAESQVILADALAAAAVTPETAWEQLGGVRGLDPGALAGTVALELDRPLGQVLADKNLVDLARHRPQDAGAVRSHKGLAPIAKTRADEILAALATAVPAPAGAPRVHRPASARAQRWAEMLLAIAHVIADETKIAARLLATRNDAEQFARVADEQGVAATATLPARATWRRAVLGTAWQGWLTGTVAIVGNPDSSRGVELATTPL
ncbi:MAG: hypothetical protein ABI678_19790 [Kofleriaceae bacterium]